MLGTRLIGGYKRQIDLGLHRRGKLDLGLLSRLLESLKGEAVIPQIYPLLLFELVGQIVDDALVEILAAKEGVAICRLHFEDAFGDLEDRDIKGAAAEVVDRDFAASLLFEPVSERRGRRLVDDARHFEPSDPASILRRLALRIIEIGGDGDDR